MGCDCAVFVSHRLGPRRFTSVSLQRNSKGSPVRWCVILRGITSDKPMEVTLKRTNPLPCICKWLDTLFFSGKDEKLGALAFSLILTLVGCQKKGYVDCGWRGQPFVGLEGNWWVGKASLLCSVPEKKTNLSFFMSEVCTWLPFYSLMMKSFL